MLRVTYRTVPRRMSKAMGVDELGHGSGPAGRIERLRLTVTALMRYERLEGMYDVMAETRGYAERLIQIAQKHGDAHKPTMEMADYWLKEKDLIHKLFKVLVPRYTHSQSSYTLLWNLPIIYPGGPQKRAILELKGNPYPPVVPHQREIRGSLVNILLDNARKDLYDGTKSSTGDNVPLSRTPAESQNSTQSGHEDVKNL